jgi:glycosyltransferase involved in cell wall biosynthesis
MNLKKNFKVAIHSHILPPAPSGQAMVLYKLLCEFPDENYLLVSRENYNGFNHIGSAGEKLPAKYYHLKSSFHLPVLNRFKLSILTNWFNISWGIYWRSRQLKMIVQNEKCDLIISCSGDLYDLPAAYLASKRAKIPFIPYMFDDYTYQWIGFNRSVAKRIEPRIIKNAKCVIVPNEYLQNEYMQRHAIRSKVIHNPCYLPELKHLDQAEGPFNLSVTNIVYTGAVYHANYDAFKNLIVALQQLGTNDLRLHVFTAQPESELNKHGICGDMVVYHDHIPNSEVPIILRKADILFLPLAFNSQIQEVIKTSAPGKLGEYLSVGRPILVHAPKDSFVSWFFRKHRCGVVVDRNDPQVLANEINKLMYDDQIKTSLGEKSRYIAEEEFSIDKASTKFKEIISSVLNDSKNITA